MGTRITLQNVRLSFPHLFQPRAVNPGDDPKYGAAFLIPKLVNGAPNPIIAQIHAAEAAERGAKWGAAPPPTAKPIPIYDGDVDPRYSGIADNHGHMIFNTSAVDGPVVVDQNLQKIINPATLYAGCYVNADIGIFPYDKGISKGIAAGLNGVQFVQDGERLDNRPSAEQMFGPPAGAPPALAAGVGQGAAPAGTQYAPATMAPASNPAQAVGGQTPVVPNFLT